MGDSSPTKIFLRFQLTASELGPQVACHLANAPNASCCCPAVCENWQKRAEVGSDSGADRMSLPLSTWLTHADLVAGPDRGTWVWPLHTRIVLFHRAWLISTRCDDCARNPIVDLELDLRDGRSPGTESRGDGRSPGVARPGAAE